MFVMTNTDCNGYSTLENATLPGAVGRLEFVAEAEPN